MRATSIKDVARRAGVSAATASRVLSGSDYPVRTAARERVLQAAAELDYVPNAHARALQRGSPNTVGVLVGDVEDPFSAALIAGIQHAAAERGSIVTILNTYREREAEIQAFQELLSQRTRAVILAGSGFVGTHASEALRKRIESTAIHGPRVVVVGRHENLDMTPVVSCDNWEAGMLIGSHLRGLGHRKVGVLAGDMRLSSTVDRIAGVLAAMADAEVLVREVEPTRRGGLLGSASIVEEHAVTALIGTADQMAMGALAYCRENKISVPQDISVTGCNDIWVSQDLDPPLTTVHLPLQELGRAAVELAFGSSSGDSINLPVRLILRSSTGPVKDR